ncbi:MAG: transposase [Candidatus Hadarchaeota archaeon]|nr:transposase [Candidatus Hadarchaeota archaeon]
MQVQKVIKAKVVVLTRVKRQILDHEYDGLQRFLSGDPNVELYSANKQQARRFYRHIKPEREYPLSIRKDLIRVERRDTKLVRCWVRIPVKLRRGGVWVAVRPHCEIDADLEICESKLLRRNGEYFLHLTVKREVELKQSYSSVLAVDLGIRHTACSVDMQSGRTHFYGRELRRVRGHYFHLRRKLGRKKLLRLIKRIGAKESRITNDRLHKIAKAIVDEAEQLNALIAIGNLKGIRRDGKGKRFNRKLNSWPFWKLQRYIEYKANWRGIQVIEVGEAYTSQRCWRCGAIGARSGRHHGLFECPRCGLKENADRNGAFNIGRRALGQVSKVGAVVSQPVTGAFSSIGLGSVIQHSTPEAPHFSTG